MRRPVAVVGQADTPASWFASLPLVTKILCVGTLLCSSLVSFKILSTKDIIFHSPWIIQNLEIWRLITPYFYAGQFSFGFAMHLMALYENCTRYERMPFNTGGGGTSADFVWMLCLAMVIFPIIGYFTSEMIFSECILFMIMYVWSRREPDGAMNIFGFKFQALYLPWVYLAIRLLMGNPIMLPIYGIVVGHLYYFLADVMPLSHNIDLIKTPEFIIRLVEYISGVSRPTAGPNATANQPTQMGHGWGAGRRLGVQ
jgi:Derlin-2/3